MLSWNHALDQWETDNRPETLEETLYDDLGLAYSYRDWLLDNTVWTPEVEARVHRLDAHITALEKLLTWEG